MTTELLKIVLIISIGQGLTLASLLVFKRQGQRRANIILATFLLATIIPLWNNYVVAFQPELEKLTVMLRFFYLPGIYGPLLYLYTLSVSRADWPDKKLWLLMLTVPVFGSAMKILHFYVIPGGLSTMAWYLWYLIVDIQILFCLYGAFKCLKRHNLTLQQNLSAFEKDKLDWIMLLLVAYALLLGIDFVRSSVKLAGLPYLELMHLIVTCFESAFIFFAGFWGVNKPQVHFSNLVVRPNRKYDNSSLTAEKVQVLKTRLSELMNEEEVFLDSDISLVSLAHKLNAKPHHLSQILNEHLGKNFYDFINDARIERAKQMLLDPRFDRLAIIDIAYQVGFNNKTSFNNAFKKFTQVTPGQFRASTTTVR